MIKFTNCPVDYVNHGFIKKWSRNEQNGLPQIDVLPIENGDHSKYIKRIKEIVNPQSKNEKSVILCPFLLMCYTINIVKLFLW